jgi:hypothetical protein
MHICVYDRRLKERKQKRKTKGKPETYKEVRVDSLYLDPFRNTKSHDYIYRKSLLSYIFWLPTQEVVEFSARSDGYLRPSDLGTVSSEFAKSEAVPFGAQPERPPDLAVFSLGKRKAGGREDDAAGDRRSKSHREALSLASGSDRVDAKTAGARFLERQKLREGRDAFLRALASGAGTEEVEAVQPSSNARKKKGKEVDGGDGANAGHPLAGRDLEEARKRAIEAYRQLRDKRMRSSHAT